MTEIAWDWAQIAVVLAWKMAPNGFVMFPADLVALPRERVMLDDRKADRITLSFVTITAAKRLLAAERGEHRATLSELQGRWHKIVAVCAWKWTREGLIPKSGVILSEYDRQAVPGNLILMASGHEQGIEYRFLPRAEAQSIETKAREDDGVVLMEKIV